MKHKILITGFEPFDGREVNESWLAVSTLPDSIGQSEIVRLQVPVEFERAGKLVISRLIEEDADAVILCGLAQKTDCIALEYCALNMMHARIPDNAGFQPQQMQISADSPAAIQTGLPVFDLKALLDSHHIPARISWSAGTYVCNALFYKVLSCCCGLSVPCGFIHVPDSPRSKSGGMDIDQIRKALELTAGEIDKQLELNRN